MPGSLAARFVVGLVGLLAWRAAAHDVMGSVFFVDLGQARAHLEVELPLDELTSALGQPVSGHMAELPASPAELTRYLLAHLHLAAVDGRAFVLEARARAVVTHDGRTWLPFEVDATPPTGASPRDFVLNTDVINHRVVSHHVLVFMRRDFETGLVGEPTYLDTLHYQSHEVRIHREGGGLGTGLWSVFCLGLRHIAQGSDHLLFLFTLLLPAGLALGEARRWGPRRTAKDAALDVARIVTAFTLGHSVTLLVGGLGLTVLPSAVVESLIACSILVSAAHVVVPLFPRRETWVALGFGLVHGLGFVSALAGLGVDGGRLVLTVLGFNLGVEVMQAALVALTLPVVFWLQGTRLGAPLRHLGGVAAFVVALAWLAERTQLLGSAASG